ncbi:AAA family ATPase [Natronoglycomyces albus]|uniref:ATP-binding protein n=1 Tax=Natronoglycomyces albus TaxID=2811108 RepID=A0A895XNW4_9ACTN|nr:ATP-binding protein [Natronoglycomyces albus]QSB05233.1 ATP-binding protein [Natronoglycomyces albus]
MILLSFTVRNHKSIRDELTLDFIRPALRTLKPKEGQEWESYVYPLAGIFGGNATGKSALLDALGYTFSAILNSSTTWQAAKSMRWEPFALDNSPAVETSTFELDFVYDGKRHLYGFEVDANGIAREWLRDVPNTRWRTVFERESDKGTLYLHPKFRSVGKVTRRELVMSRALLLEHPQLAPIANNLVESFDLVSVKDTHREHRLRSIADSLVDGTITFEDIETLLQVADIGVEKVSVQEEELPENVREALRVFIGKFQDDIEVASEEGAEEEDAATPRFELGDKVSDMVIRNLLFTHRGVGEDRPAFSFHDESNGTIAWLAVMVPALEVLRKGGLYCVDEIDSSLHPHLLDVLLSVFEDPDLNPKRAQLLFTSHDAYILSPLSDTDLEPEQVWFTDKSYDGATELSCLADFPRHRDANVAKRYLLGRYGGTPRLAPGSLAPLIEKKAPRSGKTATRFMQKAPSSFSSARLPA